MASETSDIQNFFKNQTIFITGGSGFLGKILIEKLLRACEINKIYMLMRPKKSKTSKERFQELFSFPCFDLLKSTNIDALQKVCMIDGDCQQPCLGLSEQDVEILKKETTCVIHAAANVKFDQTLKEATYNVRASRDLLELAKEMTNLKVFVYVSTAYSNCLHSHIKEEFYEPAMTAEKLLTVVNVLDDDVLQDITPQLLGKWPNTYIFTKSISENLMSTVGKDLPITVVRPAIVNSTIEEPMPGWMDNFYGVVGIVLAAALGVLRSLNADPDAEARLVPVDYVSNCVLAAAWRRYKSGTTTIYNYVGIGKDPITWRIFMSMVEEHCWTMGSERIIRYYGLTLRKNKRWNNICRFFSHTVPAHIADFFLMCFGKPTLAVANYQRLHKMLDLLSYFSTREWSFDYNNVLELWNEMSDEDKRKFNFSGEKADLDKYAKDAILGGQIYLMKESVDADTVARGKRKLRMLCVAHYAIFGVLYYLLYKLVCFIWGLFL